jgi:hypothetical protein
MCSLVRSAYDSLAIAALAVTAKSATAALAALVPSGGYGAGYGDGVDGARASELTQ